MNSIQAYWLYEAESYKLGTLNIIQLIDIPEHLNKCLHADPKRTTTICKVVLKSITTMRKKHPKTREERRTIDKVKQGEQKQTKFC